MKTAHVYKQSKHYYGARAERPRVQPSKIDETVKGKSRHDTMEISEEARKLYEESMAENKNVRM